MIKVTIKEKLDNMKRETVIESDAEIRTIEQILSLIHGIETPEENQEYQDTEYSVSELAGTLARDEK